MTRRIAKTHNLVEIASLYAGRKMGQEVWRSAFPLLSSRHSNLEEGDEIEIHVADAREFGVSRKPGREELLGRLPADFKFDRDEANAR